MCIPTYINKNKQICRSNYEDQTTKGIQAKHYWTILIFTSFRDIKFFQLNKIAA